MLEHLSRRGAEHDERADPCAHAPKRGDAVCGSAVLEPDLGVRPAPAIAREVPGVHFACRCQLRPDPAKISLKELAAVSKRSHLGRGWPGLDGGAGERTRKA
jgi:hypothetical protein